MFSEEGQAVIVWFYSTSQVQEKTSYDKYDNDYRGNYYVERGQPNQKAQEEEKEEGLGEERENDDGWSDSASYARARRAGLRRVGSTFPA